MQTAVIYARYSSYGQTEQSIEGQVRECTDYAAKNGIVILDSYIDRAMTGTNDNRTDFQRMIRDSGKGAWDMVLVYKLDRFSRNKYEMAIHRKTLRDNGVKLVSVKENIPDGPEGIILETLLEGMAEYYSVELAQKVRRGQHETRLKGNYCGGGIPYGYKVETIGGEKKYVVKEEEAAIVLRIFEEYASGKICRKIIDDLTADGIYARDGKPFGTAAVYGMLQNERYTGVYRHKTEGPYLNTFPRIVPQPLFETVQRIAKCNALGKHSPEDPYLLRGKLKCGYCGSTIRGDAGTSYAGGVSKYYVCAGRKKLHDKCKKASIRKYDLEKLVVDVTVKVLDNAENLTPLVDKIYELNEERAQRNSTLAILYSEREECEHSLQNMLSAMRQGIVTASTKQLITELESRLDELKGKIRIEEARGVVRITKEDIRRFIAKALRKEPAAMIQLLVKKAIVYDDKIEIYYNTKEGRPDGDDPHQVFCFYTENVSYENYAWRYTMTGGHKTSISVGLYV